MTRRERHHWAIAWGIMLGTHDADGRRRVPTAKQRKHLAAHGISRTPAQWRAWAQREARA